MELKGQKLIFSEHAHERMREFGLRKSDVRAILRAPHIDVVHRDRRRAEVGDFAVVYKPEDGNIVVVTVLRVADRVDWHHEDVSPSR